MKNCLPATFAATLLLGTVIVANAAAPTTESFRERFAELQAISSNSSQFQKPGEPAGQAATQVARRPAFADAFAQMQAIASNSGAFMAAANGGDRPDATAMAATEAAKARLVRWWASLLHPAVGTRPM